MMSIKKFNLLRYSIEVFKNGEFRRNLSDKKLFTPGPLSTSLTVKKAMLRDFGSRDEDFISVINYVQQKLLDLAGIKH